MLRDSKRLANKELPELTPSQVRKACKGAFPETRRKLKHGIGTAPLFYYVITAHQLNATHKKLVAKGLALAVTPKEAKKLTTNEQGWSYRDISLVKDFECGVLMFKGLAVAVYYKRQVTKIEPEPTDPVPSGALTDLEDVWARMDLFSKSPRQLVDVVREELLERERDILDLTQQLRAASAELEAANKRISAYAKAEAGKTAVNAVKPITKKKTTQSKDKRKK